MMRKLVLTGWVLLINEENELARVIIALLVSLFYLGMHASVKPYRRCA